MNEAALARMFSPFDDDEDDAPRKLTPTQAEAAIMDLRDAFERYGKCPFTPGDLVMPRMNSTVQRFGGPSIVLEVRRDAEPDLANTHGGRSDEGRRLDMRVLSFDKGVLAPFWIESFEFEPYRQED